MSMLNEEINIEKHIEERWAELSKQLRDEMHPEGYWTGELSASALAVAVAIAALSAHDDQNYSEPISKGIDWLARHQNSDGSYGDTTDSPGNISTSLLVYAALNRLKDVSPKAVALQKDIALYLSENKIDIGAGNVSQVILDYYQKDYTFSVPILTMCALCRVSSEGAWNAIPQLPFEMALVPRRFYRLLNLGVVSYAIPALIAVGIVIFKNKKAGWLARFIRGGAEKHVLNLLTRIMPESGGFLEAIPLTAFVVLALVHAGYADHRIVEKGIAFLLRTQRSDGGWPIDVDLSTWVTTLSVKSLRGRLGEVLTRREQKKIARHLMQLQNTTIHPFNGAKPGGWGWTFHAGSVPDGDDTPGALIALLRLSEPDEIEENIKNGVIWLVGLQNADGGFPTFSRGWGKLPFDQSCSDLTGHCFLALALAYKTYRDKWRGPLLKKLRKSLLRALNYLYAGQGERGEWVPLWFGNQYASNHQNPVYGTARVMGYLADVGIMPGELAHLQPQIAQMIQKAAAFLKKVQNKDGSWGGECDVPGSVEETALAIGALATLGWSDEIHRGLSWLDQKYRHDGLQPASIGLYFASLWYNEKLYPLTAYIEALSRIDEIVRSDSGILNQRIHENRAAYLDSQ